MAQQDRRTAASVDGRTVERVSAVPRNVGVLRRRCRDFAAASGAGANTIEEIVLAVSEAASNAVMHAYAGAGPGPIDLELVAAGGQLEIVIRDFGSGLGNATSAGGLGKGLVIIDHLAETMRVTRTPGGGTTVTMRFRLA